MAPTDALRPRTWSAGAATTPQVGHGGGVVADLGRRPPSSKCCAHPRPCARRPPIRQRPRSSARRVRAAEVTHRAAVLVLWAWMRGKHQAIVRPAGVIGSGPVPPGRPRRSGRRRSRPCPRGHRRHRCKDLDAGTLSLVGWLSRIGGGVGTRRAVFFPSLGVTDEGNQAQCLERRAEIERPVIERAGPRSRPAMTPVSRKLIRSASDETPPEAITGDRGGAGNDRRWPARSGPPICAVAVDVGCR